MVRLVHGEFANRLASTFEQDGDSVVKVSIIYTVEGMEQRALRIFANLAHDHKGEFNFQTHSWCSTLLNDSMWRDLALTDAVAADLLVIAWDCREELPGEVENWLAACLERKRGGRGGLMTLLQNGNFAEFETSPVVKHLRTAAQEAGVDFFAPERAGDSPGFLPLNAAIYANEAGLRSNPDQNAGPDRNWGLNE